MLLGLARDDDSVPGIGERPMAQIKPEERTTPAGRFVAERGRNAPVAFNEKYIGPIFATSKAMVYVLPDSKPLHEAFGMLQAGGRAVQQGQRK